MSPLRALILCLLGTSCASSSTKRELAGQGATLLPPDLSINQIFKTEDEAAIGACGWLWKNEPKAKQFEYCGYIIRDSEGIKATVPDTQGRAGQCNRTDDPPGVTVEGWYHSHRDKGEFSSVDKQYGFEIARYLCAPNGLVKKLTPEGTVIVK